MKAIYKDHFGKSIHLTEERFAHINEREEMIGQEDKIEETLSLPGMVKISKYDPDVLLYYRYYESTPVTKKYLVVIVKTMEEEAFILSAFFTDKIKEGETRWEQ